MMELPVVCNLDTLSKPEKARQAALFSLLSAAIEETRQLEDGFALRLSAEHLLDMAELMSLERRCCGFLNFSLTCDASEPHIWLELRGPEGTKPFLAAELGLDQPARS